jgi:cyanophycinase
VVHRDSFEVFGTSGVAVCDPRRRSAEKPVAAEALSGAEKHYDYLYAGDRYDLKKRRFISGAAVDPADRWSAPPPSVWKSRCAGWETAGPVYGKLVLSGSDPGPDVLRRFLQAAGDPAAPLVLIPTADPMQCREETNRDLQVLKGLGAANVTLFNTAGRRAANSIRFTAPLRRARAVWFSGGEQWRLAEAYRHTQVHWELYNLLDRQGVVGGAGAGARFLGRTMAGDRYGWDRGIDMLPESALHSWPAERRQIEAMERILTASPGLLGIGLDEATGILVRGNIFEVMGKNKVAVFDPRRPGWPWPGDESYLLLGAGERYNMKERRPQW